MELPSPTPSPIAQLASVPAPISTTADIEAEIRRVFGSQANTAIAVAWAESSMRPGTINSVGCCVGLFQIHVTAHAAKIPGTTREAKIAWLQVAKNNIALAKQIYDTSGWYPWEAYTKGAYKHYL